MKPTHLTHLNRMYLILGLLLAVFFLAGCVSPAPGVAPEAFQPETWEEVEALGEGTTVTIVMWGGNDQVNRYMDEWVAPALLEKHRITLRRVPMNAPEFMAKFINEKRGGVNPGTADLVWINGENFRTAREADLLWGPFTHLLPSQQAFMNPEAPDLQQDTGVPIDGFEALWGRAQLIMAFDSARIPEPPRNYGELLDWARKNPGLLTYPNPVDDFAGAAFIRSAYYELTGLSQEELTREMSREELRELSQPVIDYFLELQPHLWRQGKAYPASQAQLDDFFRNGETAFSMGFEVGKVLGLIREGVFPATVETLIFNNGSIGNSHYLAVPFNAPGKAGALLVIDFLQSPEAQLEKYRPEVWGDMPGIDPSLIPVSLQQELEAIEAQPGMPSLEILAASQVPEMHAQTIDWIKEIWQEEVGGR
ncbi:MAG: ABC transporter substrate-binding protein [Bacillota bacterium]|nr:ABC transporter substrate-binding protein [Bacillota bacterium]MDW7677002.1 ABC transporter substrate-binding protein [Bacillota bacterium]